MKRAANRERDDGSSGVGGVGAGIWTVELGPAGFDMQGEAVAAVGGKNTGAVIVLGAEDIGASVAATEILVLDEAAHGFWFWGLG